MSLKANSKAFSNSLNEFLKTTLIDNEKVLTKVGLDSYRNLQRGTPKDTGRARAGWIFTVDSTPSEEVPPEGLKSYRQGVAEGIESIKYNSEIHLTNNVEYIVDLDDGSSIQAKQGIVNPVFARAAIHLARLIAAENRKRKK